jgi:hypothetical protein
MTDDSAIGARYNTALADATERFIQAAKQLSPDEVVSAAMEIIRDVQAQHPDLLDSVLWFNFGRALGRLEEADRAIKRVGTRD